MDFFGSSDVPMAPPMDDGAFHAPSAAAALPAALPAAAASSPLISPPRSSRPAALQLHEQEDDEDEDEEQQEYEHQQLQQQPQQLHPYDAAPLSVGGPCVASLASSYMLMEYAAELKGLSQMHVVRGVRAARKMPHELKVLGAEIVQRVRTQVVAIVASLRAEIAELTSGSKASSKAKEGNLRRIRNAHGHLQAATELLNQAEVQTVTAAKKRRQSHMHHATRNAAAEQVPQAPAMVPAAPALTSEKANAVSNLAALCAAIPIPAAAASAPTRQSLSGGAAAAAGPAAAILNAQAEIQKLMQQLETMKRLQSLMPAAAAAVAANISSGGSAAVASSGPAIPLAPSLGPTPTSRGSMTPSSASRRKTIFIPKAPELTADSFFFTGRHRQPVAEGEEDEQSENSSSIPQAPAAPAMSMAPAPAPAMSARSAMLGEITARANLKSTSAANLSGPEGVSTAGAPRKRRSQSVMEPSKKSVASAASTPAQPALHVFTRRIPGVESLSLADSIKVASKIKLRRTDMPRSPGGTPCRGGVGATAGPQSSGLDVLKESLSAIRLRVQGAIPLQQQPRQQRSQSLMFSPPKFGAPNAHSMAKVAPAPAAAAAAAAHEEVDQENIGQSWGTN